MEKATEESISTPRRRRRKGMKDPSSKEENVDQSPTVNNNLDTSGWTKTFCDKLLEAYIYNTMERSKAVLDELEDIINSRLSKLEAPIKEKDKKPASKTIEKPAAKTTEKPASTMSEDDPFVMKMLKILGGNDLGIKECFVLSPILPGYMVETRITRVRNGSNPIYHMHLDIEGPDVKKGLILTAKRTSGLCINYIISTETEEFSKKRVHSIGKLHSNLIGTEFTLRSGRSCDVPPEKRELSGISTKEQFREEQAAVIFDPNILGFNGPRKLSVVLPSRKNVLEQETVGSRSNKSLIDRFDSGETENIIILRNKKPTLKPDSNCYSLDFKGRVLKSSVKNFQIVSGDKETDNQVLLQFGKVSNDTFSLDFQFPFSPLQAFAVALTSFQRTFYRE